jgi:hypothetical protein
MLIIVGGSAGVGAAGSQQRKQQANDAKPAPRSHSLLLIAAAAPFIR